MKISIPNTGSILRIKPCSGTSISIANRSAIAFTVFTFDAKQSRGVCDDDFVSDLIQLSLPSAVLAQDNVEIEMCHEHGLNLDPTLPATNASKVVFILQPHNPSARSEHKIKFEKKLEIERKGEHKIAALLESSVVKVSVSPVVAAVSSDGGYSFFTHFYGLGRQASSFQALCFERINIPHCWQFYLCIISTRPEHRNRFLAKRDEDYSVVRPLLLNRSINHLLFTPTESNVVEVPDIEGCINNSRSKEYFISMQHLLAARNSPDDAWVACFYFTYNHRELPPRRPTWATIVNIVSGDRQKSLCIRCSKSLSMCDKVKRFSFYLFLLVLF